MNLNKNHGFILGFHEDDRRAGPTVQPERVQTRSVAGGSGPCAQGHRTYQQQQQTDGGRRQTRYFHREIMRQKIATCLVVVSGSCLSRDAVGADDWSRSTFWAHAMSRAGLHRMLFLWMKQNRYFMMSTVILHNSVPPAKNCRQKLLLGGHSVSAIQHLIQ